MYQPLFVAIMQASLLSVAGLAHPAEEVCHQAGADEAADSSPDIMQGPGGRPPAEASG